MKANKSLLSLALFGMFIFLAAGSEDKKESANKEPEMTPEQRAAENAACKEDLQCWGDKHATGGGIYCREHIERLAKYSFEWTDGLLESKVSHFRWKNKKKGQLTVIGDKIKFQNGFGAYQNHIYECDYDPETKTILDVRAYPGRL